MKMKESKFQIQNQTFRTMKSIKERKGKNERKRKNYFLVWWGRRSSDRRSSIRLSSGAFLLVSSRVFGHQTRHHHLFLQMRTTSCQGSQIAIVARLHTPVSCTLCLVHPSLPQYHHLT